MIGKILLYIAENVLSDVCEAVFVGSRPSAVPPNQQFLVVRASKNEDDQNVSIKRTLYIDVYVRDRQGGRERTDVLDDLTDKIIDKFPIISEDGKKWNAYRPQHVISGDDQLGFHAWGIMAELHINTTEKFGLGEPEEDINNNN